MHPSRHTPILTLEPLIEAVQEGISGAGWVLSGLQKTTSHQFEGRWAGDSTRSAYLFFHPAGVMDELPVSVDVYLDETSRGLTGNLALVVDLRPLAALGPSDELLTRLASLAARALDPTHRRPLTLRYRLADAADPAAGANTEVRFKIRLPGAALQTGVDSVAGFCASAVRAFEEILADGGLREAMDPT